MSRFIPVGYLVVFDIPDVGGLLRMTKILEIPKTWTLPVAASFSVVLRCRLAVHLENPATRSSNQARSMWILLTRQALAVA